MSAASGPASIDVDAGAQARRGRGFPRAEDLHGQIHAVALAVIDAGEAVTGSRVVERNGVSRAPLYRQWPLMTTLITAALDVGAARGR